MKTRFVLLAVACTAWCLAASMAQAQFAAPATMDAMGMGGPNMAGMMGANPYMMAPPPGFMLPPTGYPVQQTAYLGDGCSAGGGCSDCNGHGGCNCGRDCCPADAWCYRLAIFGEFLYMRARDSEVAYAVEVNSAVAPPAVPVQVGPVGVVDSDYEPNWRGGVTLVLDEYSSLTAQYTMFESDTSGRLDRTSGIIGSEVVSLLVHPGTAAANSGGIFSDAAYDINFDLMDLDYRSMISCDCFQETVVLVGARYARLEQQFAQRVPINGNETVDTDIDFDGIGTRLGLETTRYTRRGWFGYGKGHGSLLVGDFNAKYDQGDSFDASVVNTGWEAGRMVPILDLEFGAGWQSANGYWRFSAGYLYSAWFNTVKTDEWIKAVQSNNFVGLGDGITFDGLVARVETRF